MHHLCATRDPPRRAKSNVAAFRRLRRQYVIQVPFAPLHIAVAFTMAASAVTGATSLDPVSTTSYESSLRRENARLTELLESREKTIGLLFG